MRVIFLSAQQNIGVENFHQVELLFVQAVYNFLHAAKMHFMQLKLELFFCICTKISKKNANYEEFLTKFVNTNDHTYHFLHGVLIFQDSKNHSQHKEISEARQKKSLFVGQIKRARVYKLVLESWGIINPTCLKYFYIFNISSMIYILELNINCNI